MRTITLLVFHFFNYKGRRNLISRYAAITISFHSNGKISKMNALVVADIGVNESVSQISFSSHLIEGRIVVGKVGS